MLNGLRIVENLGIFFSDDCGCMPTVFFPEFIKTTDVQDKYFTSVYCNLVRYGHKISVDLKWIILNKSETSKYTASVWQTLLSSMCSTVNMWQNVQDTFHRVWQTLSIHHMSATLSPCQNIKAHNNNRNACVRGNLSITNLLKGMALVMSVSMHINIFMLHSELDLRPYWCSTFSQSKQLVLYQINSVGSWGSL